MRTQLSNDIVSLPKPNISGRNKNTNGQTFVISSSVHVFKRPFLVKLNITHRQVTGNEGERSNVVFGLIGFDLWHIHLQ